MLNHKSVELQNRWSASLAMSTDGSFPSRPRQSLNSWAKSQSHRTRNNQRIGIRSKQLLRFERALINQGCRVGDGLQTFDWDRLAGHFAEPVGSLFDTVERSLDLRQFLLIPGIFVDLCFSLVKALRGVPNQWYAAPDGVN